MAWYSTSERVWMGATVMESPVCTPIGSKFSIPQITTQLSATSRITSSSYSFQPAIDFSTRISPMGEASMPSAARREKSAALSAMPVPAPPRMKLGRMMIGQPIPWAIRSASSTEWAKPDEGTANPMSAMAALNSSRFSAVSIAAGRAPMTSTPRRSVTPRRTSSMVRFSAV